MILQSRRVWMGSQFLPLQLEVREGKIAAVHPYGAESADADWGNLRLVPGFIDIHTHGAYGFDTDEADPAGLRRWTRGVCEEGVTAFLPTATTAMEPVLLAALDNVASVVGGGYEGAEILGVHMEGPFLDAGHKGAQAEEAIVRPSVEQFCKYQEAAHGLVRYLTIAPEHDEGFALTRYCREHGVVVSMGHSSADYGQALLAVANGVTSMTHVYNGMTPFHHRNPGLVGAALRIKGIYGEVICDGKHSHPAALRTFFDAKGGDFAIMVSDSLQAKHCPAGQEFYLGTHSFRVEEDGLAHLTEDGTIAGSVLSINQGLRILVEEALVDFETALNSCTVNPARALGVDGRKGKLVAGYDADIVALEDDYRVKQTWCRGIPML